MFLFVDVERRDEGHIIIGSRGYIQLCVQSESVPRLYLFEAKNPEEVDPYGGSGKSKCIGTVLDIRSSGLYRVAIAGHSDHQFQLFQRGEDRYCQSSP